MNVLDFFKSSFVFLFLLIALLITIPLDIQAILWIYLFIYCIIYLISFAFIYQKQKRNELDLEKFSIKNILKFGIQIQSTNFLQLINYRFTYFVVEKFLGLQSLGILSVAVSIAENVWIINKSICTVLYSKLLNLTEVKEKISCTIQYTKMSYLYSFVLYLFVLILPDSFFIFLFGESFTSISILLFTYFPAVVLLSFVSPLNHFFTAQNLLYVNIFASVFGAISTILFSLFLIPSFGINFACISLSFSYFFMSLYILIVFSKKYSVSYITFFSKLQTVINPTK